jgi:hemoglobin-like flavoprotein
MCVCTEDDEGLDPDIAAVMPQFYVKDCNLTTEVVLSVQRSWNKIMHGTSMNYLHLKSSEGFQYEDAIDWFGQTFFINLYEAYPAVISLFHIHLKEMGRIFVVKFDSIVKLLDEPEKCAAVLEALAKTHSQYGVHAVQYGIFGDILFLTLRNTLKSDYTDYTHTSWIKVC